MHFWEKAIEKLEGLKAHFWQWLMAIFAFCFLRRLLDLTLESDHYSTLIPTNFLRNYVFWYVGLFIAIALILHFFTRERVEKTTKAAFVFWPLMLLVPLVDFVFSGGTGYILTYISAESFWSEFFSFFGYIGSQHITYGQTIALITGFALLVFYAFYKTNSILKTLGTATAFYLAGYFYASLPIFFLHGLSLPLLGLVLFESIIWLWRFNSKKLIELIKQMHFLRVIHYSGILLAGIIVFIAFYPQETISFNSALFALISAFFGFQSALALNNIFDGKKTAILEKDYKAIAVLFALISLTSAIFIKNTFFLIMSTCILLSIIYSVPPIKFKKTGFFNNALIGLETALMFAAGFTSQTPDIKLMPLQYFFTIFIIFSIAANVKDFKDLKEDKKQGIKTLPVIFGEKKSAKILALLTSICFPLTVILLGFFELLAISVLLSLANAALFLKFKTEKTVFALYFAMILIIAVKLLGIL